VRVVAVLADGAAADDAVLLAARGSIERIEVNLVEVFAVVADRDGAPVRGLAAADFTVRLDGAALPVERFRVADEVPLLLGLLVDTSESMWPLLPDTKRAAARFLADTLRERDRAFLVSFDDRPRLVHPPTGDLVELLGAFGALVATGRTALYDAIVFALTQVEADAGRRALVLLTDGQDWGSRYGPGRAAEYGRALGVPVYVLVFGDLYGDRRPLTQPDLDAVTGKTGGRLFYIERLEQLAEVYARIAEELRSQYVLAVATDHPLAADELARIEVEVAGRGLRVRAAVGARGTR
jgi:VWFA-related protein